MLETHKLTIYDKKGNHVITCTFPEGSTMKVDKTEIIIGEQNKSEKKKNPIANRLCRVEVKDGMSNIIQAINIPVSGLVTIMDTSGAHIDILNPRLHTPPDIDINVFNHEGDCVSETPINYSWLLGE